MSHRDKLTWLLVLVIFVLACGINMQFVSLPGPLLVVGWIVLLIILGFFAWRTRQGKAFYSFIKEAKQEIKRVTWPTRKETLQMSAFVIIMTIVLAFILWGVDSILLLLIRWFTGHGG